MALKIDSYRFGEIKIGGQVYRKDVIVFPDRVLPNWWRASGHSLTMADLSAVLENPPQVLILGQGAYGRMAIPEMVKVELEAAGIRVISLPTNAACKKYNQMREEVDVVAALHLTC